MELAIPLLALGGLFVVSNQNNNNNNRQSSINREARNNNTKENYTNMGAKQNYLPNTNIFPQNYPVTNQNELVDNVNQYVNSNAATDKYFNQNNYEKMQNNGVNVKNTIQQVYSLSGDYVAKSDFQHNNMVPFYSGKIKGQVYDNNIATTILDNMVGSGSQNIQKIEQAPLFKPQENIQYAYGTPNNSDFYQSRVNPGMNNANVKPFQSEMVGPGLNQGFGKEGSGGFNSGMEARNTWLPKTVDELRVDTNPKIEYSLENHEGPSYSYVQNRGMLGKVEKYTPDTFFIQTQDRWLTTTGNEKGQMLRPVEEVHNTSRTNTSQSYTGVAGPGERIANYVPVNYEESRRVQMPSCDVGPSSALNKGDHTDKDNFLKIHTNYPNNRSTLRQPDTIRSGFSKAIGAVISPIMDAFMPTKRDEYSSNYRIYGDAGSKAPSGYVLNPNDTTSTTIKETTMYTPNMYVGNQIQGSGYQTNSQTPITNQRDTTTCGYVGDVGGASNNWGDMSYEAAYNQTNNESKEKSIVSRINQGNTNMFNQQMNVNIARIDSDRDNNRQWVPSNMPQMAISKQEYGQLRAPQQLHNIACERMQPDLLAAFRSNPYTHSLTDCV